MVPFSLRARSARRLRPSAALASRARNKGTVTWAHRRTQHLRCSLRPSYVREANELTIARRCLARCRECRGSDNVRQEHRSWLARYERELRTAPHTCLRARAFTSLNKITGGCTHGVQLSNLLSACLALRPIFKFK